MKIGSKIRAMRIEHNLSSVQVAEMLNVSESTYRKYETDRSSPSLDMLEKIAKMYQKDVVDLLSNVHACQESINNNTATSKSDIIYQMCKKMTTFFELCITELDNGKHKPKNLE